MKKTIKIDEMIYLLKAMKKDIEKQLKISLCTSSFNDLSQKKWQKINVDLNWIAIEQIKRRHELHALAVEIGFSERRDSYDEIELTDGWHRFTYKPRKPV